MLAGKGVKRMIIGDHEKEKNKRASSDNGKRDTAPGNHVERSDIGESCGTPQSYVVTLGKESLRLAITIGQYGPIVRLMRGERFITYSGGLWHKIRRHVPRMRRVGFRLDLTADKDVACEMFDQNGKTYVKFHAQWDASQWDGKGHTFINFDEDEWLWFVRSLHKVDGILPAPVVENCSDCNVVKQVVSVGKDGRSQKTMLEPDMLRMIQQSNANMPDPFYLQCEYCGEVKRGRCHCHEEECRVCNIGNYCDTCGACKVLAVEMVCESKPSST